MTILPWSAIYDDVRSNRLRAVELMCESVTRTVGLCIAGQPGGSSPVGAVAQAFRELVAAHIQDNASRGMTLLTERPVSRQQSAGTKDT